MGHRGQTFHQTREFGRDCWIADPGRPAPTPFRPQAATIRLAVACPPSSAAAAPSPKAPPRDRAFNRVPRPALRSSLGYLAPPLRGSGREMSCPHLQPRQRRPEPKPTAQAVGVRCIETRKPRQGRENRFGTWATRRAQFLHPCRGFWFHTTRFPTAFAVGLALTPLPRLKARTLGLETRLRRRGSPGRME